MNRQRGFTLFEVMVAIGVATLLFAICTAIFVQVSRYKARSEKLLFITEEAGGTLDRMARDLEGLYAGGPALADYWKLETGAMGTAGDRITLLSATENPGKADYCTVCYYVKSGRLYRVLSGGVPPGAAPGAWPAESESVLAEGVDRLTVSCTPDPPAAGKVPKLVAVTLQMSDPDGKPPYRRFTATVRPGSEENQ